MSDNKIFVEWSSPARPYKERTREFYTTILSIAFLLGVILLLLKEFLLIGVIMAFAFLSYVLATHKPDNVTHQITEAGIVTDNKLYKWDELTQYWVAKQWDQEVIMVKTLKKIPGLLVMVISPSHKASILSSLEGKLPEEKPADSFVDKASRWLSDKIPLESK
ncbi:MAG: hypothetical protein Fur0011_2610 [Candidatus Microgenomates bacterium]